MNNINYGNYRKNFLVLKYLRLLSSFTFLALFSYIFIRSLDPFSAVTNYFLRFDPLIFLTNPKLDLIAIGGITIILILTLLFGRFFCGWVCPLGTLIEIIDFLNPFFRRRRKTRNPDFLLSRYPPSLFILAVTLPAIFFAPPILQFLHPNIWIIRIYSLSLPGIVFILILTALSLISRRFWCRYVCPLGALYGLISRFSLFSLKVDSCSFCRKCNSCPMAAVDYEKGNLYRNQCILCFEYEYSCPNRGFGYSVVFPKTSIETEDYSKSRRRFLKDASIIAGGIAAGSLISAFRFPSRNRLLRPPGVLNETQFVERCLRCFQCVRSCPNEIIKITGLEAGFSAFLTPHLSFAMYGCDFYCQVCQTVCPNEAIPLQPLYLKQITPIGKAKIDTTQCIVFKKDTNCLVCEEFCPVPDKAIVPIKREKVVKGKKITLRYPHVISSRCIGCGICEANCPVEPTAIRVFA